MNREIKFRAWDKEEKTMIPAECLAFEEYAPLCDLLKDSDRMKYMQFIGLQDKNGKEIYEGDIVHGRCNGLSAGGVVVWVNGGFAIEDKKRNRTYSLFNSDWKLRVDGNIYENPKLLEG